MFPDLPRKSQDHAVPQAPEEEGYSQLISWSNIMSWNVLLSNHQFVTIESGDRFNPESVKKACIRNTSTSTAAPSVANLQRKLIDSSPEVWTN